MRLLHYIQDIIPALPDSVPSRTQELSMLKSLPLDEFLNRLVSGIVSLAINLAIAIAVFYIGKFVINKIYNVVRGLLLRRRVEVSLATFVLSFVRIVLYFILIVTVIGILGIETSSFLAIFASAGVAIGMALSGTLQNFAGGVLILLLKPYKVGDYIEAQGYGGTVREIQIFHTVITTADNKSIIIPNGGLSTGSVNNWSRERFRRVDWTVGISYGDDVDTARSRILAILDADELVVKKYAEDLSVQPGDPEPEPQDADNEAEEAAEDTPEKPRHKFIDFFRSHKSQIEHRRERERKKVEALMPRVDRSPSVVLSNLADSAVELKVRAWTRTSDYWTVYHRILEQIYVELPQAGVSFPFPQLDVHITPSETTTSQSTQP